MHNILDRAKAIFAIIKKPMLRSLIFIGYVIALVFLFILILNLSMIAKTNDNIYTMDEMIKISEDFDCIIILGAGVRKDGSPTPMLSDRITVGYEAFIAGKSDIILVSGDSKNENYTETIVMEEVLTGYGVDDSSIINDGYGLSTYESIWRVRNVYECKKILIVSQGYHLYRAIYIAQKMGINAYGLDAALRPYYKQPWYSFREFLARFKDIIFTEMRPTPEYKVKWEGINE